MSHFPELEQRLAALEARADENLEVWRVRVATMFAVTLVCSALGSVIGLGMFGGDALWAALMLPAQAVFWTYVGERRVSLEQARRLPPARIHR